MKRATATRLERRTIVVFCEGASSEPGYVDGLRRTPSIAENTALDIQIAKDHGVPLTLVKKAAKTRADDPEVDEVWCLFDVEWPKQHPNLLEAIGVADKQGVLLAVEGDS